ncbi:exported hypothetical protein [uncultured Mycobacterium sp.]|uniref:Uncharacterized protein n=1 Tax=uncultured Mycobacterium sp. TaxID=171292 RepID=A0A1Y5NZH1_9MYCO|nr:exported hypothetical protein [uncultured Mycobacterium sp.]
MNRSARPTRIERSRRLRRIRFRRRPQRPPTNPPSAPPASAKGIGAPPAVGSVCWGQLPGITIGVGVVLDSGTDPAPTIGFIGIATSSAQEHTPGIPYECRTPTRVPAYSLCGA